MSKRDKHRPTSRPTHRLIGLEPKDWRQQIESLISRGKAREAVEAAKQFLKQTPGSEAEALAVAAYQARIQALLASGMHHEARALAVLVNERFPTYRERVTPLIHQSEVSAGNFQTLLTELSSAEGLHRRELEAILTRGLHDPVVMADSPVLSPDHPLKRAARAVCDLFTAVTTGPLTDGALAPLHEIPHHSPLAPWKLLIRALDAFYRRADAAVLANLAGIPADSGPAPLVPVLRRLVAKDGPAEGQSSAIATLLDKVSGGRTAIQAHLKRLSPALGVGDERTALAAVQGLLPRLETSPAVLKRTFIASVLHHWQRQGLHPQRLLRVLPQSATDPDIMRLAALTIERSQWDAALILWDAYLTAAIRTGALAATGPAMARVLLHMATLFPADPEEVWDVLDVDSEEEVQTLVDSGQFPACFDRGALLERARAADPDPRVFRALVAHYDQREPKRAVVEAEVWRRTHRQDLEPLLYLIRAAEARGAIRKALTLLAEAEALNRVHPEVRQSRFRLLLAGAERRITEGKLGLALADLERLEHEPRAGEGDHRGYLLALRWVASRKAVDAPVAAQVEGTLATTLGNPVLCDLMLRSVARSLGIEAPQQTGAPSQAHAIEGLARACDLFRALNRPLTVPPTLLAQVEKSLATASVAQLHSLCAGGLWIGQPALTYAASGHGLAQDGALLHRFLLGRGQSLQAATMPRERERARQCLRVARELAGRCRDMEAVRQAAAALQALPSGMRFDPWMWDLPSQGETPPTQDEILETIAAERQRAPVPHFTSERKPRRRRKAKSPRRQPLRGLFEALFT